MMVRRVFFCFHYERDIWRAMQVRKSWVTQDRDARGFFDASLWEQEKKKGDEAIKRLIDEGLQNTSVTAVLIGAETASRKYVQYEIEKSKERDNGLLGIYIYNLENQDRHTDIQGPNPLEPKYHTYYWFGDNGYENCGKWIELAASDAGR